MSEEFKLIKKILKTLNYYQLYKKITLKWSSRFYMTVGQTSVDPKDNTRWQIKLSKIIWPHLTKEEQYEILTHEIAHVIYLYKKIKERPHGKFWQKLMKRMGFRPKAKWNMSRKIFDGIKNTVNLRQGSCLCSKNVTISPTIAKRIQLGKQYICRKCKKIVILN